MVQKSAHRGVHSGNTLRASNCRYSRRYHNQACIVSRVRADFVAKMVGGSGKKPARDIADSQNLQNVAVNVALSLNKQSRWLLPSALKRQITSNDIANTGLTVSLLERHKLKRHANCVSFHSNMGAVKRIQPQKGHYFSFQFPAADGVSRRARRREQRMELARQLKEHNQKIGGRVVEVYTEEGRAREERELGESEVRYEVFYPCPASSSISHNPKYIKQDVSFTPGDDGEHVQQGKPRKQHRRKQRKRMSLKDVDDLEFSYLSNYGSKVDVVVAEANENVPDQRTEESSEAEEKTTTEFLLSSLIEKAERLQQQYMGDSGKIRRRRRSGGSKLCGRHHEDDKSHIVYLPAEDEAVEENREVHRNQQLPSSVAADFSTAHNESTRVLLPTDDVTVSGLAECFGQKYYEAACRPRKFVLDVTENVREVLKKCGVQTKVAETTESALSFLVFVHDGVYDDESDVYKIFLNTKLRRGLLAVQIEKEDVQDLYRSTVLGVVSQAMDLAAGIAADLQEANFFPMFYVTPKARTATSTRELKHHLAMAEVYVPSVQRVFQQGSDVRSVATPSLTEMLDEDPAFCDVCYDDVSPLTLDSSPATAHLKCGHRVCDACWEQHVHSRLQQGFVRLTCPGYDCQTEAGVGVMLSISPLDTVDKLLQRQEEVRIGASQTEKWCPGEFCGRVLRLQVGPTPSDRDLDESELQQDIVCACGAHVCFRCLETAHWPASCKQAEEYRLSIATTVFPNREAEVHDDSEADRQDKLRRELEAKKTMVVEGKHCPSCKTFVNKNGGCPNMTCRCGQIFCWRCGKPGYAHTTRAGCVDEEGEKKLTTTLVVRHINSAKSAEEAEIEKKRQQQQALANRRQKVSLLERAAEHRNRRQGTQSAMTNAITTLAKTAATAARKDPNLAQHVINLCTSFSNVPSPASTTIPSHSEASAQNPSYILNTLTSFLKRAARSKQEVHELAEYTLVLVKDLPDSLLRRRALRVAEDLTAFCTFTQSIFDAWRVGCGSGPSSPGMGHQEAVKAVVRLTEIQRWVNSALSTHVTTVRKLRSLATQ
nr:hypothetical protein BaRGS_025892 [Batillaria attramentaria]